MVDSTNFYEDLGGDLLVGIEFVMRIEEEFDINISDDEVESFMKLNDGITISQLCEQIYTKIMVAAGRYTPESEKLSIDEIE